MHKKIGHGSLLFPYKILYIIYIYFEYLSELIIIIKKIPWLINIEFKYQTEFKYLDIHLVCSTFITFSIYIVTQYSI